MKCVDATPHYTFCNSLFAVCDVMGEIDMDGPRDEEGRILDPEFYPVIIMYNFRFYSLITVLSITLLHASIALIIFYSFFFCIIFRYCT
jgi:hypothetical protein